jgi:hypothetical protein
MHTQEWSRGEASLERARAWTEQADSCLRSVMALERNITETEAVVDSEIASAESDIARTTEFIRTFDQDVPEDLERELHEATARLDQARSDRRLTRPDILAVARAVRTAHEHTDRILDSARSARETAVRLRENVQSAFLTASAAISTASEYIEDHSSDVGRQARTLVEEAAATLAAAKLRLDATAGSEDFEPEPWRLAVAEMERAGQRADEAYRIARAEFLEAESRRDAERQAALLLLQQQQLRQQASDPSFATRGASSHSSFGSWGSGGTSFGGRSGGSFGGGGRSGGSFGGRSGGKF